MSKLGDFFKHFKDKYDEEQKRLIRMDRFLDRAEENNDKLHQVVIGEGTKMELFDTLYNWKKILVDERKWASAAEKREVNDIYSVYHDGLNGNGQGKVYFEQIMSLPENPPESNN